MASYQHLRQVATEELDRAIVTLNELLGGDSPARGSLTMATRDIVGRTDPNFKVAILAGALARAVGEQQRRLDLLEGKQAEKRAEKASG